MANVRHLSSQQLSQAFLAMAANQAELPDLIEELSCREIEIMRLLLNPITGYGDVCEKLSISKKTLETHISSISGKLGVQGKGLRVAQSRFVQIYHEYLSEFITHYIFPIPILAAA